MTKEFMQTYKVYLTPLSPIHIGCGEDFEPTNYVIDEQVLYHFDPSSICLLENERTKLLNLALKNDLLAIQRFFKTNKRNVINFSHYFTNVSAGVAQKWESKIGKVAQQEKDGSKVLANLAIERTAYLTYSNEPYIPGSGFKGALATAILDAEHRRCGNKRGESAESEKLLKKYIGEFEDSLLRTVKFSDFVPLKQIYSNVYYHLNYKKKRNEKGELKKGVPLRRESIIAGQYRAFSSEVALWENRYKKGYEKTINEYFQLLNQYYLPIFEEECENLVANGLVRQQWVSAVRSLLNEKNVALIRLGKNGADSKIYRSPNMAQIKIMLSNKEKIEKDRATTIWLAGNNDDQQQDLLPLGWALVEIDQQQENEKLKNWCEQQLKFVQYFDKTTFIQIQTDKKVAQQETYQLELAEIQAKVAQRLAEKQALLDKENERKAALSLLNENQQQVLELVNALEDIKYKLMGTNRPPEYVQLENLCETLHTWSEQDRAFFIKHITFKVIEEKITLSKKAKDKFKKYGLKNS